MMDKDMNKQAKVEILKELKRVMQEMMMDSGDDESIPVAAELEVVKAKPIDDASEMAPEMEENEDELEVDLSDPAIKAAFKEFLKSKKEM